PHRDRAAPAARRPGAQRALLRPAHRDRSLSVRITPFPSLGAPASGMRVYQTWIDAVSDNVSNLNTINPAGEPAFQERYVHARSAGGGLREAVGLGGRGTIGSGSYVAGAEF